MPKGQGATGKSLGKQEADVELKALTSLAEAMEWNKLTKGEVSTEETHFQLSDGEHHHGERFAIYFEVEKRQGLVPTPTDRSVLAYIWTDEIIRDHVSRDIPEMTQLVVLSPSGCLAFKGKRSLGEGYMGDQALEIVTRLEGHRLWAGMEAMITACPITLMEARHILVKVRDFIRKQRIQKLTSPKLTTPSAVPKMKEMTSKAKELEPQCGKVHRADKYWAKKLEQGYGQCTHTQQIIDKWLESLTHPPLLDTPYSSGEDTEDGPYESAIEPQSMLSDNPSPYEVTDSELEDDDIVAYDSETSHHMTIADRHRLRRKQWLRHECHEHRCQKDHWARGASLPLFKNSSKERATTYTDWRNSVDELIADKLDQKRIRSLVLQSLEGPPKDTAHLAYKNGKGSLKDILWALDKLYSQSASYVHLQSEMCNIQQTYKESAQDYYECLVRLQVAIQDKYLGRLHDLELERMVQEAFYNGLREEYKPMVIHMLESLDITVGDLVEAVQKIEAMNEWRCLQRIDATRYLPSTSSTYNKPTYGKDKSHDKDKKDWKDKHNGCSGGVIKANPQHVESEEEPQSSDEDAEANPHHRWRCTMEGRLLLLCRLSGGGGRTLFQGVL